MSEPTTVQELAPIADDVGPATHAKPAGTVRSQIDQWGSIFTETQHLPPGHWSYLAGAIRQADALMVARRNIDNGSDAPFTRGSEEWCEAAADVYDDLEAHGAYADTEPQPTGACVADPARIGTWLAAPAPYLGTDVSVAESMDLAEPGNVINVYKALDRLIVSAQDIGVFGVAGHRIELWHGIDHNMNATGHRIAIHPETGPPYASKLFDTEDLLDWLRSGIDAAVIVLGRAAEMVNETLASHQEAVMATLTEVLTQSRPAAALDTQAATAVAGRRPSTGGPGRAFVPLGSAGPARPAADMPQTPTAPARRR